MIAESTLDMRIFSLTRSVNGQPTSHGWKVEPLVEYVDLQNSPEMLEKHGTRITTPDGSIHMEPAGRRSDGTLIMDVYAWPTLVRIRLQSTGGSDRSVVSITDVGMELRYDWNEKEFARLAHDMLHCEQRLH